MRKKKKRRRHSSIHFSWYVRSWDRTTFVGYKCGERLQSDKILSGNLTQITLKSELLSQIRGSVVVLRDQIHKELGNLIDLIRVIKLG